MRFILLAMGEIGFPSRILSPAFGGIYTYAAPLAAEGTAAGQVCARQLRGLYRIEKLGRTAKTFGVIADPVRHSLSPVLHNRAMQARRLDAVYLPFLVQPPHLRDFTLAHYYRDVPLHHLERQLGVSKYVVQRLRNTALREISSLLVTRHRELPTPVGGLQ